MAVFELESNNGATFFKAGKTTTSRVVGYESLSNRIARYAFTSPAEGSSHQEIVFYSNGLGGGTKIPIRFYIGTDENSHTNGGANSTYHGTLTLGSDGKTFTGSSDILLLPNTTYYIWFFPSSTAYGYYAWYGEGTSTLTTSGGGGVIYIGNGSSYDAYQVYIGNGSSWDLCIPYVGNGSSWDLCS